MALNSLWLVISKLCNMIFIGFDVGLLFFVVILVWVFSACLLDGFGVGYVG